MSRDPSSGPVVQGWGRVVGVVVDNVTPRETGTMVPLTGRRPHLFDYLRRGLCGGRGGCVFEGPCVPVPRSGPVSLHTRRSVSEGLSPRLPTPCYPLSLSPFLVPRPHDSAPFFCPPPWSLLYFWFPVSHSVRPSSVSVPLHPSLSPRLFHPCQSDRLVPPSLRPSSPSLFLVSPTSPCLSSLRHS